MTRTSNEGVTFIIFTGSSHEAGVDREDFESVTLNCTTTSLSSIQPSRVGLCANPFARCGRSCVSHRWSDHEHKRVKFIWYRLRVWSCVVNVNFCAMLSRCQALCRNAAAIKCSHRDARPSAWTGLIPGKVRMLVRKWDVPWHCWIQGWVIVSLMCFCLCQTPQKRRLDQPFSHNSDRSFMINYFNSCAPRAVSSHLNGISCLMMAVLFLCRDQGLCNKKI